MRLETISSDIRITVYLTLHNELCQLKAWPKSDNTCMRHWWLKIGFATSKRGGGGRAYLTAGNFGEGFNMLVWQFGTKWPK